MKRCKAKKRDGKKCQAHACESGFCFAHDPSLQSKRTAARKRGGHNSRPRAQVSPLPSTWHVDRPRDLQKALALLFRDTWSMGPSINRAKVLAAIGTTLKREGDQSGELEQRLEQLEGLLLPQQRGRSLRLVK